MYLCDIYTCSSHCSPYCFRNTKTDLKLPMLGHQISRGVSRIAVQHCGMAWQPSSSKHPLSMVVRKLVKVRRFFLLFNNFEF